MSNYLPTQFMRKVFLFAIGLVHCALAFADHAVLYRNADIKNSPVRNSEVVYEAEKGEMFELLDGGKQVNGYYHLDLGEYGSGYLYRTLVRLYEGPIPDTYWPDNEEEEEREVVTENRRTRRSSELPEEVQEYYSLAEGLTGEELKNALHRTIRGHKRFTYAQAYDIIEETDRDPRRAGNVLLLYTLRSQKAAHRDRGTSFDYDGAGYSFIDAWNREHVWPKSRGFDQERDTAYTDVHHLRAADRSVNSARQTRSFDMCEEFFFDNKNTVPTPSRYSANWTWEPPDATKGDIARMLFYMAVRYEGPDYDLELVDEIVPRNGKEPLMGKLSTLLEWHRFDPVDDMERRRNNLIQNKYQGNRNPFIDHPEWAFEIWGEPEFPDF
jgi:endonuclease I